MDHLWSQCGTDVDLEITADTYWTLPCTSLAKTLPMMVEKFPEFHTKLLALWKSKPCTKSDPYSLLVYGDELVPGNVLAQDPRRKIFGFQACIKDFGPMFVKSNASWIPLFCVRHDIAQEVPGGMSYILQMYLRHLSWWKNPRPRHRGSFADRGWKSCCVVLQVVKSDLRR